MDTEYCAECGEEMIPDPDGSVGVWVHLDTDIDRDHVPLLESLYGM